MLWAALVGWAFGVTINGLGDSLPWQRRLAWPACAGCTAARTWWAWSGLLGAAIHQGRCPYCGRRRGRRALVIEALSVLGTMGLAARDARGAVFLPALLVGFVLLLITVIDLEHRLILHVVVLPAAIILGTIGILDPARGALKTLGGGLAGAGSFYLLFLLGEAFARAIARARRRPLDEVAFGFGDVTLAGLIGLIVGWPAVVLALLIGILAAGVFSLGHVLVMVLRHRYSAFTPIPYGPFLVLGASLVYFGGQELIQSILLQ